VKGFDKAVNAYQVVRQSTTESRFEALRASTTPLVGRDEKIELLLRRWAQAKGGDGQVVLICGEAGIGKSRITQTLVERVAGEPHIRLRFFCSPHHQDSALYPVIAHLERAAGFRREDTAEQRVDKLEALVAQGTNDVRVVAPLLADLLAVPTGERYPALNLTPQKRKEKTLTALTALVEGLSAREPVLMVYEDVHWSDPTTRESLDLLVDRLSGRRVLAIITFRPEFSPPWIGRPHVTMLTLNRLPPRQRAEMIAHVTGGKALPKEISNQIVERTDGVPLFIEELTKSVVETGLVTDAGESYVGTGPAVSLAIPTTLHASLLARLDRLAPTREVAQIGAALGRSFSHELISAVAQMSQHKLDEALEQLVAAELIFRRGTPPNAEYTFKHALVQDAAYSTLLRSRRQQIHARIATILESHFSEIVAAQPVLMAQHSAEAGFDEKAVGYWLKAGRQSVARSAMAEAVVQLQKGLDLLAPLHDNLSRRQQELDLLIVLGPALIATKGYSAPNVGDTLAQALELAEELHRSDYLVPLLYGGWVFNTVRAETRLALSHAERLEEIGRARADMAVLLLGQLYHGVNCFLLGEFIAARALLEQCDGLRDPAHRATYAALAAEDPHAAMLAWLGVVLTHLGYIEQGRARMSEAISEARRLQQAYTLSFALCWAGWMETVTSSALEVQRLAEELIALANEHGFPWMLAAGLMHYGWSSGALRQPEQGASELTKGLALYRAIGAVSSRPFFLARLAETYAKLVRPLDGLNCLAEAAQILESTDERQCDSDVHRMRGELLSVTGDQVGAEQNYNQALAIARRQHAKIFELRAATSLARLWRDQGKRTEGHDLLAPIYDWFTEGLDTPVLQEAKALLNELAL
jgi:tetratricopeptide (TPR) repeat protein